MKNKEEFTKEELMNLVNEQRVRVDSLVSILKNKDIEIEKQNLELSTRLKHIHGLLNSLKNKDIQIEKLKIDLIEKDIDIENLSDQLAVFQEHHNVALVQDINMDFESTVDISGNLEYNESNSYI